MTAASDGGAEWVEIIEPQSHERMFANPISGEILLSPPEGAKVKPMTQNQWWELYDQASDKNYYYNAHTGQTIWNRPSDDADIISLTKLQNVPAAEESNEEVHTPLQQTGARGAGGGGGGVEEEVEEPDYDIPPDAGQNGQRSRLDPNSSSKKSDIFSKGLETLSPLAFEVRGETFSGDQQQFFPPGNSTATRTHQHHTSGQSTTAVSIRLHNEKDFSEYPTRGDDAGGKRTDIDSYNQDVFSSHETFTSAPGQDNVCSTQGDQCSMGRDSRRSLSPSHGSDTHRLDAFQGQNMSYEKKSRTLEMPVKQSRKPRGRLSSNPSPPPKPAHPAPKPPPDVASRPSRNLSQKGSVSAGPSPFHMAKTLEIEIPDGDSPKKSHNRVKSDIPPAPPPFKPPVRPATIGHRTKSSESLEHFKDLAQHRRGFFRKKVTIANMLSWTKDPIKQPMILCRDKQQKKEAVDLFKLVLQYMGDRKTKVKDVNLVALDILTRAWEKKGLRDELYIQLCRQTSSNDKPSSLARGWELFTISLAFFPPSIKFRSYLEGFLWRHVEALPENKGVPVEVYAQYCHKRVEKMAQSGAKKGVKKPSVEEIVHAKEAPFRPSMFGTLLEDVMELQSEKFPGHTFPWVVEALTDAVLKLNGPQTEGIFRVPGDIDEVNALKLQMDKGVLPTETLTDPHIPASLLKLWFRELEEPLIPENYYQDCIDNSDNKRNALSLIGSLPELNRKLLLFLIRFLKIFITPENIEATKMGVENIAMVWAPNFLRCPSDDHALIFQNTRKEMAFLRLLLKYLDAGEASPSPP